MVVAMLLRLGCVALLAWIGYVHLHLWQEGYRQIPTNGPLFLLDAVAGFALGRGCAKSGWLIPVLVPCGALSLPGAASPRAARQESLALVSCWHRSSRGS
jgi:hypothetical protein